MENNLKCNEKILEKLQELINEIKGLSTDDEKISIINQIKLSIHEESPFKNEPVDCVLWIESNLVEGNDYNPNSVALPEMKLLEHSIREDGYTQPIVAWRQGNSFEVVDGFHRNIIGKETEDIKQRIKGYLPITIINQAREQKNDRVAATIRHNRARGKHKIDAMSNIVQELSRKNWTDQKIAKELGMDADEVLRLKQITGLAELFKDEEFSQAWEFSE